MKPIFKRRGYQQEFCYDGPDRTTFSYAFSPLSLASTPDGQALDFTHSTIGYAALLIFAIAYTLVMLEEYLQLRKSKPVLLAAGLIWAMIGYVYQQTGSTEVARQALEHNLLEYAELLLFLLVAMTYISAMEERRLFDALKAWMINRGFNFHTLFWITGWLAFFISPIADNLTTALLMCAVVMKVGGENPKFVSLACINIVIAANAGGAFSPFGDITTLMVWQAGHVSFLEFMDLFLPSLANYLVPALVMSLFVPHQTPSSIQEVVELKRGAKRIVVLFLFTILSAIGFHAFFHFPPVIGMMMGLAYLQFLAISYVKRWQDHWLRKRRLPWRRMMKPHLNVLVPWCLLMSFAAFLTPNGTLYCFSMGS